MKVLLLNTSDKSGGAAIAAHRFYKAYAQKYSDIFFLVKEKYSHDDDNIQSTNKNWIKKKLGFLKFAYERFLFRIKEKNKSVRFAFSIANFRLKTFIIKPTARKWTSRL